MTLAVVLAAIFTVAQVEAAVPAQDTWVLCWDGYDYYVKAGSPDYTPSGVDGELR